MTSKKLKEKALESLRSLEDNGGPEVVKIIKAAIPTYSNSWEYDNPSLVAINPIIPHNSYHSLSLHYTLFKCDSYNFFNHVADRVDSKEEIKGWTFPALRKSLVTQ